MDGAARYDGRGATVTGWGITDTEGWASSLDRLMEVGVDVLPQSMDAKRELGEEERGA